MMAVRMMAVRMLAVRIGRLRVITCASSISRVVQV
jgi:hypothetical protein